MDQVAGLCSRSGPARPKCRATALSPCSRRSLVANRGALTRPSCDQLPPRRDQPMRRRASPPPPRNRSAPRGASAPCRYAQGQRHAEPARPPIAGTVDLEAVQVLVLDDVRSAARTRATRRRSAAASAASLPSAASSVSAAPDGSRTAIMNPIRARDRAPSFQIDLHPLQVFERENRGNSSGRGDQILFLGRSASTRSFPISRQWDTCRPRRRDACWSPPPSKREIIGRHEVAQRARTVQFAPREPRVRRQSACENLDVDEQPGRNRAYSRTRTPVAGIRRHTAARPAPAHTETIPGVGSQPHSHSSSGGRERPAHPQM